MNILVVGGAGYVGGALTDILVEEKKHKLRVYDALLYEDSYRKPVEFVLGDVRDCDRLKPHLKWADAVLWIAALVGDPACALNPDLSIEINQDSVKWLSENYDGRIMFLSTCSVYGAQDGILDENSPTNPLSVYAITKLEAEKHLAGKNALVCRLGTLFGVGDIFSRIRLDLVVNTLTVKAHEQKRLSVFGGGQFRPLLHVRDAARALVENVSNAQTGIFNLHSENVTILNLARKVCVHFPGAVLEETDCRVEDTRNYRVSSQKAKTLLAFKPRFSIDDGIEELKNLLDSGRLARDVMSNPRYANESYLRSRSGFKPGG